MPGGSTEDLIARILTDTLLPGASQGGGDDDDGGNDRDDWTVWDVPSSRAIQTVKHRLRDGMMTVRFRDRELYPDYLFMGVPRELWYQWKRVQSAGKFYHRRIKGQYNIT